MGLPMTLTYLLQKLDPELRDVVDLKTALLSTPVHTIPIDEWTNAYELVETILQIHGHVSVKVALDLGY